MPSSGMLRSVALVRISQLKLSEDGILHLWDSTLRSVRRMLLTANDPSSQILVILMMKVLNSFETSVLSRATRLNIPEEDITQSHRRGNFKSHIA
jgi:hypothetical protein